MYKDKHFIAIIPARGGSKGIPNKNIVEVVGKPLIAYTIETALQSKYLDRVVVSTDSEKIACISKDWGADVPFLRPSHLATDNAKTIDTIIHTLEQVEEKYDYVMLLQPTQPLRRVKHIDEAIEQIVEKNQHSLVSISPVKQHPILMRKIDENGRAISLLGENSTVRRQDFREVYIVDGTIYINKIDENLTSETSLNDNEYVYYTNDNSIDIDTFDDLEILTKFLGGNT